MFTTAGRSISPSVVVIGDCVVGGTVVGACVDGSVLFVIIAEVLVVIAVVLVVDMILVVVDVVLIVVDVVLAVDNHLMLRSAWACAACGLLSLMKMPLPCFISGESAL